MTADKGVSSSPATVLLREDLTAFLHAVKKRVPENAAIFANRFASDAFLLQQGTLRKPTICVGGLLRITAEDFALVEARQQQANIKKREHITLIEEFCRIINDSLPSLDSELNKVCIEFFKLQTSISTLERDIHEIEAYAVGKSIVVFPREALIKLFIKNKDDLLTKESRLIKGLCNEMARLSHVVPFNEKDLCLFVVLKSFSYTYDYVQFKMIIDQEAKEWIKTNNDTMIKFMKKLNGLTKETCWLEASELVSNYIALWREYWIRYGQLGKEDLQPVFVPLKEKRHEEDQSLQDKKKTSKRRSRSK